eukprot:8719843-Lingulodinium_polyedra.AAC.1
MVQSTDGGVHLHHCLALRGRSANRFPVPGVAVGGSPSVSDGSCVVCVGKISQPCATMRKHA